MYMYIHKSYILEKNHYSVIYRLYFIASVEKLRRAAKLMTLNKRLPVYFVNVKLFLF